MFFLPLLFPSFSIISLSLFLSIFHSALSFLSHEICSFSFFFYVQIDRSPIVIPVLISPIKATTIILILIIGNGEIKLLFMNYCHDNLIILVNRIFPHIRSIRMRLHPLLLFWMTILITEKHYIIISCERHVWKSIIF
jgi:hypothetical protein